MPLINCTSSSSWAIQDCFDVQKVIFVVISLFRRKTCKTRRKKLQKSFAPLNPPTAWVDQERARENYGSATTGTEGSEQHFRDRRGRKRGKQNETWTINSSSSWSKLPAAGKPEWNARFIPQEKRNRDTKISEISGFPVHILWHPNFAPLKKNLKVSRQRKGQL